MNRSEFRNAIGRHGENLSAWPRADRDGALDLLAREPEFRSDLDEAASLRAALLAQPAIRAPAGLADRIVRTALAGGPDLAKAPRRA